MGKTRTSKYRLEINGCTPICWFTADKGKPTQENLEKYVFAYAKSLEIGGPNEHISKTLGHIPYPSQARLVNQESGEIVAKWQAGMFQVW